LLERGGKAKATTFADQENVDCSDLIIHFGKQRGQNLCLAAMQARVLIETPIQQPIIRKTFVAISDA
jgi:hypothetical protein